MVVAGRGQPLAIGVGLGAAGLGPGLGLEVHGGDPLPIVPGDGRR